jgi:error-prone DNA polymerase
VLKETLGVIIYQEQVIQVAMAIAGFSPGQADSLRRAMSRKRSREAMERLRNDFLEGARRNGIEDEVAGLSFQQIASFAEFGFCKAHAAALAETTYRSAWLKLYYPAEYYCALLNCQPMGFYSPEVIVNQAKHEGIRVLPVDINLSQGRCTMEEGQISLGFRYVKAVGEKAWQRIVGAKHVPKASGVSSTGVMNHAPTRDSMGLDSRFRGNDRDKECQYTSLEDFYTRTRLDREAVENLIMVGAFDFLHVPRRQLFWQLGMLVKQPPDTVPLPLPIAEVNLPQMTLKDKLAADYQIQGLSAKHHPMEVFRASVSKNVLTSSDIAAIPSGAKVIVAGCVVCRQMPGTAKGHVFITLEDEFGLINVILRPQVYDKYRQIARLAPVIIVEGTLQKHDGIVNIVAQKLRPIHNSHRENEAPPPMPLNRVRNFA